jgi:hypothetical protein
MSSINASGDALAPRISTLASGAQTTVALSGGPGGAVSLPSSTLPGFEDVNGKEDDLKSTGSTEIDSLLLEMAGEEEMEERRNKYTCEREQRKKWEGMRQTDSGFQQQGRVHDNGNGGSVTAKGSLTHLHGQFFPSPLLTTAPQSNINTSSQPDNSVTNPIDPPTAQLKPPASSSSLFKTVGLPPGGFPAMNSFGQRTCWQCGQTGRQKDGKCIEKWGPGPQGPGTVCDR